MRCTSCKTGSKAITEARVYGQNIINHQWSFLYKNHTKISWFFIVPKISIVWYLILSSENVFCIYINFYPRARSSAGLSFGHKVLRFINHYHNLNRDIQILVIYFYTIQSQLKITLAKVKLHWQKYNQIHCTNEMHW